MPLVGHERHGFVLDARNKRVHQLLFVCRAHQMEGVQHIFVLLEKTCLKAKAVIEEQIALLEYEIQVFFVECFKEFGSLEHFFVDLDRPVEVEVIEASKKWLTLIAESKYSDWQMKSQHSRTQGRSPVSGSNHHPGSSVLLFLSYSGLALGIW